MESSEGVQRTSAGGVVRRPVAQHGRIRQLRRSESGGGVHNHVHVHPRRFPTRLGAPLDARASRVALLRRDHVRQQRVQHAVRRRVVVLNAGYGGFRPHQPRQIHTH